MSLPLARGFGETTRPDRWWVQPLIVLLVLGGFVAYATWAGMQNDHYTAGPYLSPFYSPVLLYSKNADPVRNEAQKHHAWFGEVGTWWPWFLPFSPAALILAGPAGFRLTCYYYRGAYYKAFIADPPACAVGEPRSKYSGENSFPLIFQNAHRYFLYLALLFLFFLAYDAWCGLWFPINKLNWSEGYYFGIGIGTVVLGLNVFFLGGYTLGCHSFRHLVGGVLDRISGSPTRKAAYDCVTCLNRQHPYWAWMSLVWVGFTDVYIRLVSMGVWHDWNTATGWN